MRAVIVGASSTNVTLRKNYDRTRVGIQWSLSLALIQVNKQQTAHAVFVELPPRCLGHVHIALAAEIVPGLIA